MICVIIVFKILQNKPLSTTDAGLVTAYDLRPVLANEYSQVVAILCPIFQTT